MTESFNPVPIVAAVKYIVSAVLLSVALFIIGFIIGGLAYLLILLMWAVTLFKIAIAFLRAQYHVLTLEKNTITYTYGIISRNQTVLPYSRVTEASYDQGFLQRIFKVGTLRIDSAGGSRIAVYLPDIRDKDLKRILKKINKKIEVSK